MFNEWNVFSKFVYKLSNSFLVIIQLILLENESKAPSRTINRKDHDEEEFILDLISKRKNVEEDKCKFI